MESFPPTGEPFEFPIAGPVEPFDPALTLNPNRIAVRLTLVPTRTAAPATLVVISGDALHEWNELIRLSGERLAPHIRTATIRSDSGDVILIRPTARRKRLPSVAWPGVAYAADAKQPTLFLPVGMTLRPKPKPSVSQTLFGCHPLGLTWIEPRDRGIAAATVPLEAFRPLSLKVQLPKPIAGIDSRVECDLFSFESYQISKANPLAPISNRETKRAAIAGNAAVASNEGWIGRFAKSLLKKQKPAEPKLVEEPDRISGLLASSEAMTVGPAGAAQRADLEARVLKKLHELDAPNRAALWSELADAYSVRRRPADAALCWMNAIWDSPAPSNAWFDRWVREETFAMRRPLKADDLGSLLAPLLSVPAIRLATTHFIRAAFTNRISAEWLSLHGRFIAAWESVEQDLPLRLSWLARFASSCLLQRDELALARGRDILIGRLKEGLALDRDAPAFLRFAGESGTPHETREWLLRTRDPAKRWVRRMTRGGTLQRFGLDGESEATSAYCDLLYAWAAGRMGERAAAAEWSASASAKLEKMDNPVHSYLRSRFLARIREARDGFQTHDSAADALVEPSASFERFVVDKLRSQSSILEPYAKPSTRAVPSVPHDESAAREWTNQLPHRLRSLVFSERETADVVDQALAVAKRWDTPNPIAVVAEFFTGSDAPPLTTLSAIFDRIGISFFTSMRDAGFDATPLVRRISADAGTTGDLRSAVAAAGWLSIGRDDLGMERLDACRTRLYSVGTFDLRERTALAVATSGALGLASSRVALGRLEEMYQRLEGIDVTGSTNRYFTLKPLLLVETVLRSAVGHKAVPSTSVRNWLAADERTVLSRIAKDIRDGVT